MLRVVQGGIVREHGKPGGNLAVFAHLSPLAFFCDRHGDGVLVNVLITSIRPSVSPTATSSPPS